MKNVIAATILLVYTVSSGGIVLVEYSCHETGASGVTTPAPRSCYAPSCEEESPAEPDECCDHACCEIDVRVNAPDDQMTGGSPDPSDAATTQADAGALVQPSCVTRATASTTGDLPPPFSGHTRPIRI